MDHTTEQSYRIQISYNFDLSAKSRHWALLSLSLEACFSSTKTSNGVLFDCLKWRSFRFLNLQLFVWFGLEMASSAFKSTTKRTPIGASVASNDDSASTNRSSIHRRSRSLSRFSHPLPSSPADKGFDEGSARQGRFVNTSSRGSGFPEISLDDLAVEFFGSGDRGRSAARSSESSGATNAAVASNRRGRSVSRHSCAKGSGGSNEGKGRASYSVGGGKVVPESNSRRRRSLSVVRYQISDSEVNNPFHFLWFGCGLNNFLLGQ